jgi:hypothetical protein
MKTEYNIYPTFCFGDKQGNCEGVDEGSKNSNPEQNKKKKLYLASLIHLLITN